jgi:1,4-alpha-glucan branching enzyme
MLTRKHFWLVHIAIAAILAGSSFQLSAQQPARDVSKESARQTRDWVRDGVIYEIYPRAFSSQGNFNGITARLDNLKDLGVTILWLMPIHPIGQEKKKGTIGSPYAVRDYYGINPDYGTKQDLQLLIKQAHSRGMKVIIDIVANHTSWDSVLMKHPEFYKHDAKGNITYPLRLVRYRCSELHQSGTARVHDRYAHVLAARV